MEAGSQHSKFWILDSGFCAATIADALSMMITYCVSGVRSDGFFTGGIFPASTTTA
jgi:hypothetical protein